MALSRPPAPFSHRKRAGICFPGCFPGVALADSLIPGYYPWSLQGFGFRWHCTLARWMKSIFIRVHPWSKFPGFASPGVKLIPFEAGFISNDSMAKGRFEVLLANPPTLIWHGVCEWLFQAGL